MATRSGVGYGYYAANDPPFLDRIGRCKWYLNNLFDLYWVLQLFGNEYYQNCKQQLNSYMFVGQER
jgi:hypothetical protein